MDNGLLTAATMAIWEVSTRRSFGDGEGYLWDLRPERESVQGSNSFVELLAEDGPMMYRAVWTLAADSRGPALLREKIPSKRVDARPERIAMLIADPNLEQ